MKPMTRSGIIVLLLAIVTAGSGCAYMKDRALDLAKAVAKLLE